MTLEGYYLPQARLSFLRTISLHLSPLPAAKKIMMAPRQLNYVSVQSVRCLESDLEVSDNGDPLTGLFVVSHSLTTVKERLRKPVREIE